MHLTLEWMVETSCPGQYQEGRSDNWPLLAVKTAFRGVVVKTTICFFVVKTTGSCENNWLFIGEVQARADGPESRKK